MDNCNPIYIGVVVTAGIKPLYQLDEKQDFSDSFDDAYIEKMLKDELNGQGIMPSKTIDVYSARTPTDIRIYAKGSNSKTKLTKEKIVCFTNIICNT